jgi:hypothetical protein
MTPAGRSVILVATDPLAVESWVEAIRPELCSSDELIITAHVDRIEPRSIPGATWISILAEIEVPRARAIGFRVARCDRLVFAEDAALPCSGWLSGLSQHPAASGTIDLDPALGVWSRSVGLFEFGDFRGHGPGRLAGVGFTVERALLESVLDRVDRTPEEIHEHEIDRDRISFAPEARMAFTLRRGAWEAIRERFLTGRSYGRERGRGRPTPLGLPAIPAIAAIQAMRVARILRRYRRIGPLEWIASMILVLAWSVGEGWGRVTAPRVSGRRS